MKTIYSEWLDTEIYVCKDIDEYSKFCKKNKLGKHEFVKSDKTRAFYQYLEHEDGSTLFLMCFVEDEIMVSSVVHECSHITDCIFEFRGIGGDTEVRAYFISWLFNETYSYLKHSV